MAREDEVRLIAYAIWEEQGCLDGHDCEHWFRAETIWEQQQEDKAAAEGHKSKLESAAGRKRAAVVKKKG